jgi:hypothetical protein
MSVPNGLAWAGIISGTAFSLFANYGAADAAARAIQADRGYFGPVQYAIYMWPTCSFTIATATIKWFSGSAALTQLLRWGRVGAAFLAGLVAAVAAVAVPAGVQSFTHMTDLAIGAGISDGSAWMLPVSADGLIVACSIALLVVGVVRERVRAEATAEAGPAATAPTRDTEADQEAANQPAERVNAAELPDGRAKATKRAKRAGGAKAKALAYLDRHGEVPRSQLVAELAVSDGTAGNALREWRRHNHPPSRDDHDSSGGTGRVPVGATSLLNGRTPRAQP